jgi:hypothetical protein
MAVKRVERNEHDEQGGRVAIAPFTPGGCDYRGAA